MATGSDLSLGRAIEFRDDTAVNVVGLLKGPFGDSRIYPLALERFPLGDGEGGAEGLVAEGVEGEVKLTRLREAIMARVEARGTVAIECARCLRPYEQPFAVAFSEEYRQLVDVRTGIDLPAGQNDDEEVSRIGANHELDLGEILRQEIVVALPMRPDCGEACPGPEVLGSVLLRGDGGGEKPADDRFAALADLLGDDAR